MSSSEEKKASVEASTTANMSNDLNEFLLECEKDFSKRYTEEDEDFAALLKIEDAPPPVVCPWYSRPPNYDRERGGGHRNYEQRNQYDHRNNYGSRNHSNERSGHDSYGRNEYKRKSYEDRRHGRNSHPY